MNFTDRMIHYATKPVPLRTLLLRRLLSRWPIGSYEGRVRAGAVDRPWYAWCLYYAAVEAKALGYSAMTAVELGVAGGNGLVSLCSHGDSIRKELGIEVVVVGFDAGTGLPASKDPRDVQYFWPPAAFPMDVAALEQRLQGKARVILGDVATTVRDWNPDENAPLGAVMFDLDLYSSTMGSFALLEKENVLPRMWCYFDDICVDEPEIALTDYIGEREAIRQFNLAPERRKMNDHLSPAYVFRHVDPGIWHHQIYLYHRLSHPRYEKCLYAHRAGNQLALRGNSR